MAIMSRYTDTSPVMCEGCGWWGKVMDCRHGYEPDFDGDAVPCDYCPICGNDQLTPIEQEPVLV